MSAPGPGGAGGGAPGRSRGRARGRPTPTGPGALEESLQSMQAMRISPTGNGNGNGNGSNGNGNGNGTGSNGNGNGSNGEGAALRGRGGYRGTLEDLNTRPENVDRVVGTSGQAVKLLCNYFRMNTPNVVVNNFHVDFKPEIEAVRLRRQILFTGIPNLFEGEPFIFDGMSNLKSMSQNIQPREYTVPHPGIPGETIVVSVRHTEEIPWGSPEMMRMFNTQMRSNLRYIGWVLMGRNYYDVKSGQTLQGHNIQLMPGVITAIAQHDAGLLLVVDSSTKFIRTETVLSVMSKLRQTAGERWLDEARKQICGAIVMTTYNNRTYKVDDIVPDKNAGNTTFDRKGQEISLVDYYKQQYQLNANPNQPLIECLPSVKDRRAGQTGKLYLLPQFCQLTGLTDQMRNDFQLMRKIGDVSRLPPKDRVAGLKKFITTITSNEQVNADMDKWRTNYDPNLLEINGRVLDCEKIFMGGDDDRTATPFKQMTGDFGKEIRSKMLFSTCTIGKWTIITSQRDQPLVGDFGDTMRKVCQPMGINLLRPNIQVLPNDRVQTFVTACQELKSPNEMVVILVPNNNKERYDAIKKMCYCENPMASQVIVSRTLQKKPMLMSVCTKVAIQMATKLGAQPWALKIPPKDLMVVGYDTYHDSLTKGRSVGGFCASMNNTLTQWYSRVSYHENSEEMSANFAINLKEGIKRYFDVNKNLPKRIIIYRDGVSEGMISHVFNFELKQMKDALSAINKDNPPQLAFVIVTKRVNARFFGQERGQYTNPIPGTIIDTHVTRLLRYDFYLISQSVRQGTVTPTMYNIIYDQTGLKPEHHQQLAYKLTHLYFNWQGTIRVPAPCQYAHKLAFLTGTSLHREPSILLADRLFYL